MKAVFPGVFALLGSFAIACVQAGPPAASGPTVTISLGSRQARAIPHRQGFSHTGGGNIDVAQPTPDTLVVTMTGVAVAGKHPCKESLATLAFDLVQCFEINVEKPEITKVKLTLEGRLIGLLRGSKAGTAHQGPAAATITAGDALVTVAMPGHHVGCGENLSVNDREGPFTAIVGPGSFTLAQTFAVSASNPWRGCCSKAASAEFAPDPALDPLWISYWEPFHGAAKKDFGFQVTVRVAPAP